jgi:hypothetical protein
MEYPVEKSGVLNSEFHAGNLPGGLSYGRAFGQVKKVSITLLCVDSYPGRTS